jgi:hypothetical protein
MKRVMILGAALAALALSSCANDAYLKAQADAAVADGNARVAEAQARAEEARAVIALSAKVDAGGAAAYLVTGKLATALGSGGGTTRVAAVQRPRDWLDYFQAFTSAVGTIGNIAVPIITVRESGKTSRAGFDRDVRVEEARQTGETGRIQSVAQIARDVVTNRPDPSVTNNYTLSGNGVIGNGTYNAPTTTTRNCPGGSGAAGGTTDAAGQGGTGGSGQGGTC